MTNRNSVRILCDDGGAIILQVRQGDDLYQHMYHLHHALDAAQCVRDIRALEAGGRISDWDGNDLVDEGAEWIEQEQEGYQCYDSLTAIRDLQREEIGSYNVRDLYDAAAALEV